MFKAKNILLSACVFSLIFTTNVHANINNALHNMCSIVIADDPNALREKIQKVKKNYRLKLQHYYSGISCAGNSLIRTALLNNANETGKLLIHKLPKSELLLPEADGKTLQQWINQKNLSEAPLAMVLINKVLTDRT